MLGRLLKFQYTYLGTAVGRTDYVDKDGNTTGEVRRAYYILLENGFGARRYKMVGRKGGSALCVKVESAVEAWKLGGPLPDGEYFSDGPFPSNNRDKKQAAKLYSIEGGRARGD